jgi:hypothetical protein
MRRLTNKEHTFYEIWSEYHAESVFVDHKPTKIELLEISLHEQWIGLLDSEEGQSHFINSLRVEPLKPIYTNESIRRSNKS